MLAHETGVPIAVPSGKAVEEVLTPYPLIATVRGLPGASSVMVRVAVLDPTAEGRKVTEMVHKPPAEIVLQVFVWEKSALLVPEIATPLTVMDAVPELRSVRLATGAAAPVFAPAKVTVVAERLAAGACCTGDVPPPPPQAVKTPVINKMERIPRVCNGGVFCIGGPGLLRSCRNSS